MKNPMKKGMVLHNDIVQKKDNVKRHGEKTAIYKPKNARANQKLGEKPGTDNFLETSEQARPCQYLDFGLPASRVYWETINFCYSKPPSKVLYNGSPRK